MPDVRQPIKVSGEIRAKEAFGRTKIEFIDASDAGRDAIRGYVYGKITE